MKTPMIYACLLTVFSWGNAHAQTARPEQAEKVSWPSMLCTPTACNRLDAQGHLFAAPGAKKVVLISHGSQGIDSRMYDYVDSLRREGFAALVIDHWRPRGIGVTHEDYLAASLRGGNELNMVSDSLTAADWLRSKGYEKVGSIGESQGASAAIVLQQKWAHVLVERNIRRIYGSDFRARPLDAVVGLYGYCGFRHATRDAYVSTPFLFITGEVDDETPSKYCERYVPWMNERGGNAKIIVIPGEGHSFDAPYKRHRNVFGPHYAKCDILVDETGVTELNSGEKMPGATNINAMLAKCVGRIYHSGHWKDRFVAVPHWTGFFRQHL
ncbi:MAG: dienelactone hydrolase family protein [Polaromonas sp.]|nr:dienelactone hydrolase family protein [Polaromonas sp.]